MPDYTPYQQRIIKNYFKNKRYSEGLKILTSKVANRIADHSGTKLSGVPPRNNKNVTRIDLTFVHECDGMFIFGNHTGFAFSG